MRSIKSRILRLRLESGITSLELLVASTMSLIVLAATVLPLEVLSKQQPRVSQRGSRVQEARTFMERMTRDLRQTYLVSSSSSTSIDASTYLRTSAATPAEQRRVIYSCSSGSCTRQEGPTAGNLNAAETMMTGITNTNIFAYEPDNVNPTYMRIRLTFDVKADSNDTANDLTLADGVQFRNLSQPE